MTRSLHSSLLAVACGTFALGACSAGPVATAAAPNLTASVASAPAAPVDAAVRKAMGSLSAGVKIESMRPSPISGLTEVMADGEAFYVSNDGRYLISGNIIDVTSKRNLTESARAVARRGVLKDISAAQMIVFAPSHPKYTVTVFTDVDCGYCRKLHSQIAEYNKVGIAVDYLFFPRTGIGGESYDKAVSVWCAADRRKALTDSKNGAILPKANCTNPVSMDYKLGLRVGVNGTPAIYAADGTQIGGYLPPADMRAKLDALAANPGS